MDPSPHKSSTAAGDGVVSVPASTDPIPAPNSNSGTVDDQKESLSQIIDSVDRTLGLLHKLYLTVSSFSVASQLPLLQRLNTLVAELDGIQKLAENCNFQIPLEVVNLIDDGKNPDQFTRDVINSFISKNQITKGKTDALKSFRKHLLEELNQAFPDEVMTYKEVRAAAAAAAARLVQAQNAIPNGDVKIKPKH
ncbi:mediator of RNA polymerase II transcription subunit 10b-like isoform X3 [Zingiber officinale]|uniref:mediator of RNA polymerase II transcription subunit 10b-like isoform X3 n=1 Tax=Zingiber officinale TaxID=94328 RepID=UPI001C4C6A3C|nr:mediator of RNA polymerase II transcription subunit 10b-like isoform X3 [Zingiber officinale]